MRATAVLTLMLLLGCGASPAAPDAGASSTFIALSGDFDGFERWMRYDVGHQVGGSVHVAGARSIFLRSAPPHGATTFPVGTLLVKVVHPESDAGLNDQVFAMSKRGGSFNDGGAVGWEWFELDLSVQPPSVVWRGALPPSRRGYGGGAGGACNECHAITQNDFVLAPELLLGNF